MWKSQLKSAVRHLFKNKLTTLNNICCLVLGYLSFFYIYQYYLHETTYDQHVKDHERIYRLTIDRYNEGELTASLAETFTGCGPDLADKLPEIEDYTRTHNTAVRMNGVVSYKNDKTGTNVAHKLKDFYYADSTFLTFFNYRLIQGDPSTALNAPNTAVITESLARVYFGEEDPMGKVLLYEDEDLTKDEHVITGVMKDPPTNTHLPFRLLLSYNTFNSRPNVASFKSSWRHRKAYTYFKLHPGTSTEQVEEKMAVVAEEFRTLSGNRKDVFNLEPLTELHFIQGRDTEPSPTNDRSALEFIRIISLVVLLIALINYINLSTSSLLNRTTDIGIKKILGASGKNLMTQHFMESLLVNFSSIAIALGGLILFWNKFNIIAGVNMPLEVLFKPSSLTIIAIILIAASIISSFVPSLILAGINPVKALMGNISLKKSKNFRISLTVFQFTLSFALITATLIVYSQLRYMQSQDLGINLDRTMVIRPPGVLPSQDFHENSNAYRRFLSEVSNLSYIEDASASLTLPGHENVFRTNVLAREFPESPALFRFNGIDSKFISAFDMELKAGRTFKDDKYDMDSAIILSESAIEMLGFKSAEEAIGAIVDLPNFRQTCEIVGVVNDYRLASLKSEIEPTAFLNNDPLYTNFFALKINEASFSIDPIIQAWNKNFPGNPIDYFYLDDYFNRQYDQEQKMMNAFVSFALLAVILASIGLIGLSIFTLKQKIKEISIRKVLGSSVSLIYYQVTFRFVQLIALAILLGVPIAWYFGDYWLSSFPVRISLNWDIFVLPGLLLLLVSILSISIQIFNVANTSPVKVLRSE